MLKGDAAFIPAIAEHICKEFINDGYDGHRHHLENGSIDISLAKGDFFKSVLGMDTALKIRIEPSDEGISFDAGIGVFGKEKLPTVLSMFFAWPVILTHLWGLVKQSQLDDYVFRSISVQFPGGLNQRNVNVVAVSDTTILAYYCQ